MHLLLVGPNPSLAHYGVAMLYMRKGSPADVKYFFFKNKKIKSTAN